ncbi:MAG: hypothetical protein K6C99_10720 [Lachnospiraceae bacterium]|nr:hypothetical protein [Lachnospiraceae bacterium]
MTKEPTGVSTSQRKDGTVYYRASLTRGRKHISLGSYDDPGTAHRAYEEAVDLLKDNDIRIIDYSEDKALPFEKWVCLINYRDNRIYIANPIYILRKMFYYYLSPTEVLKFDADDLFYYSSHKIMKRGGHYFAADYGSQVNILNRHGIKSYAVEGRDYFFINGDISDFRSSNLDIVNRYAGVTKEVHRGKTVYRVRIHINGNYIVGDYPDEITAAIAYNKAADTLAAKGFDKNFVRNDIADISEEEIRKIYSGIRISPRIIRY